MEPPVREVWFCVAHGFNHRVIWMVRITELWGLSEIGEVRCECRDGVSIRGVGFDFQTLNRYYEKEESHEFSKGERVCLGIKKLL